MAESRKFKFSEVTVVSGQTTFLTGGNGVGDAPLNPSTFACQPWDSPWQGSLAAHQMCTITATDGAGATHTWDNMELCSVTPSVGICSFIKPG